MMKQMLQNPVFLALLATLFTWGMTALGSAMVFFFKSINLRVLNMMLGFASGVMVAASVWSLLIPAMDAAAHLGKLAFLPAAVGLALASASHISVAQETTSAVELDSQTVVGETPAYRSTHSVSVKNTAPLFDTPQTIQVIPAEVIKEQ